MVVVWLLLLAAVDDENDVFFMDDAAPKEDEENEEEDCCFWEEEELNLLEAACCCCMCEDEDEATDIPDVGAMFTRLVTLLCCCCWDEDEERWLQDAPPPGAVKLLDSELVTLGLRTLCICIWFGVGDLMSGLRPSLLSPLPTDDDLCRNSTFF